MGSLNWERARRRKLVGAATEDILENAAIRRLPAINEVLRKLCEEAVIRTAGSGDYGFALSIQAYALKNGFVTKKQLYWLKKMAGELAITKCKGTGPKITGLAKGRLPRINKRSNPPSPAAPDPQTGNVEARISWNPKTKTVPMNSGSCVPTCLSDSASRQHQLPK